MIHSYFSSLWTALSCEAMWRESSREQVGCGQDVLHLISHAVNEGTARLAQV